MTELRKKAIDTCNRALEVLIAAYTVLKEQRAAAITAGKDDPEALLMIRKVARSGATVDVLFKWANSEEFHESLVQMGLDILLTEMKELGFDMEGTKK